MAITLDGTAGISTPGVTDSGALSVSGATTLSTGVLNIGSGQIYKDASGNVGIGTSSPSYKLQVTGSSSSTKAAFGSATNPLSAWFYSVDGGETDLLLGATATNHTAANIIVQQTTPPIPLCFYTSNTERLRIDSSGNLLVGTTSSIARISVYGSGTTSGTNTFALRNSAGTTSFYVRDDGYVVAPTVYSITSATAANVYIDSSGILYRSTSSAKYKNSITDATHGLAEVLKLRPVTYKGNNDGDTVFGGLIAEEVHDAGLTEFVQYAEDGTPDALAYGNMVSLAFKAIQELTARLEALEAK